MSVSDVVFQKTLSDENFQTIARIARNYAGISLGVTKKSLVYSRLSRRLREGGFDSFDSYCSCLNGGDGEKERRHMVSALTTNVTSFFREEHHFTSLAELLRRLEISEAGATEDIRLWSAACSSGEEPYSIAMTVLDCLPPFIACRTKILATDIDAEVLERAQRGAFKRYDYESIMRGRSIESYVIEGETLKVSERVRAMVRFRQLNLVDAWPFSGSFHAIFCRNVAIYFDRPTQDQLWRRLADRLLVSGELYLGHSERIAQPMRFGLESIGQNAYRKTRRESCS